MSKIPVTIFVGFLGSGKTTIISHLIDYLQVNGQQTVFIKNEVGNADLDAQLMKGKLIQTRELLNGCICCTLVGPLNNVIDELIAQYQPDRILIESAGTADPSTLAMTISHHPNLIRDGLITIVDVVNFQGYDHLDLIAQKQAEFTDLIVFNKVELVDEDQKRAVVGYVRELNQHAPIVEAPQGKLNPDLAFGLATTQVEKIIQPSPTHEHHAEDDHINSIVFESDQAFDPVQLTKVLDNLPKNIFRVKGIVLLKEGVIKVLNGVFKRFDYTDLPANIVANKTKLIFIGYQIEANQEQLFSQLKNSLLDIS
jgi:G3E family GTPase